jgi:hypothetical protein
LSQFGGQLQVAKFCHFSAESRFVSTKMIEMTLSKAAIHSYTGVESFGVVQGVPKVIDWSFIDKISEYLISAAVRRAAKTKGRNDLHGRGTVLKI